MPQKTHKIPRYPNINRETSNSIKTRNSMLFYNNNNKKKSEVSLPTDYYTRRELKPYKVFTETERKRIRRRNSVEISYTF